MGVAYGPSWTGATRSGGSLSAVLLTPLGGSVAAVGGEPLEYQASIRPT